MGWRRQRFEEMPGRYSIGRVEQVERCIYSREGLELMEGLQAAGEEVAG
jgi:hypothetical protein